MKVSLLFLLLLLTHPAAAQYQFRIQANAAALRTHLSNASDNASELVASSPKITPNGGLTLSWVNTGKNGFQGVRTGLEYLSYKQTTEAGYTNRQDPTYKPEGLTSSQLHYLSIPLEARFGLSTKRSFTPFVTLGAYSAVLLNYKETMHQIFRIGGIVDENFGANTTVQGKSLSYRRTLNGVSGEREDEIAKGIYRPFTFGLTGSVGLEFNAGKRSFFALRVPVRYGLTEIEQKGAFEYTSTNIPRTYNYWDFNTPKGLPYAFAVLGTNEKRSATYLFSYGLELSYGIILTPKKEELQ